MNQKFVCLIISIFFPSLQSLPYFIFDGIESFHECSNKKENISFSIYGTLTDLIDESDLTKYEIEDYFLESLGTFKCNLSLNYNNTINEKRKHRIKCSLTGKKFQKCGYILEKPKIHGFDFMVVENLNWPNTFEKKMFIIEECNTKIELDKEQSILVTSSYIYSNPIHKLRNKIVDNALLNLPKKKTLDESRMIFEMKNVKEKFLLNQAECAYFVYKWITQNIAFDCGNYINNKIKDYNEINTYNKGMGLSYEISLLFKRMNEALGLETGVIMGYSKLSSFNDVAFSIPSKTDHFWNYVKIDSSYYLIDVSSGSGYCNGDYYIKDFNSFYFCPNPEFFNHLYHPIISKWQLLPNITTLEHFFSKALLLDKFYEFGFKKVYPDSSIINVNKGYTELTLSYDESNKSNILIFCELFYLKRGVPTQVSNSCLITKGKNEAKVNVIVNDKQEYILIILAGTIYYGVYSEYEQIFACKINSTNVVESPLYFPNINPSYLFSDIELIEPLYDQLVKGSFYNFKIKTSSFDNLYLKIDDKIIREFIKKKDNIFEAENLYIFGNIITVFTKDMNNNKVIVEYKTVFDRFHNKEHSYPEVYPNGYKSILFSPLKDTLKRGSKEIFKIKNNCSNKDIVVIDGSKIHTLTKIDNVFIGNVRINKNSTEVVIAEYNENGYSIYYKYKTI